MSDLSQDASPSLTHWVKVTSPVSYTIVTPASLVILVKNDHYLRLPCVGEHIRTPITRVVGVSFLR